jgi:cysteine desulfurase/selenocysteine lyase
MKTETINGNLSLKEIDWNLIRQDFPILKRKVHGQPLVYLDNAATSQKPNSVIEAIDNYYRFQNANIHRGVHYLSSEGTAAFEKTREEIRQFIHAEKNHEIIFTRGATESINLVAHGFGKAFLKKGQTILISAMEHHSNIVPWQMIAEEKEAKIGVIPMNSDGELILEEFDKMLDENIALVSVSQLSNSLGTINPIRYIIEKAHALNIPVLIDGAQSAPHMGVDVQELDCDFYVFSGHKTLGPTGIGVLYGKEKWLEKLPPYQGGGEMIKTVTFQKTTFNELPFKFEAGTPHIEGGICLGPAIQYLQEIGMDEIHQRENELLNEAKRQIEGIDGIQFIGTAREKSSVLSFLIEGIHPYDIGVLLDQQGIAVRTGHHCTQPVMDFYGIPGTVRASFSFYNDLEDIHRFSEGLKKSIKMLV